MASQALAQAAIHQSEIQTASHRSENHLWHPFPNPCLNPTSIRKIFQRQQQAPMASRPSWELPRPIPRLWEPSPDLARANRKTIRNQQAAAEVAQAEDLQRAAAAVEVAEDREVHLRDRCCLPTMRQVEEEVVGAVEGEVRVEATAEEAQGVSRSHGCKCSSGPRERDEHQRTR